MVFEMPPTWRSASNTIGRTSDRCSSSYAAVRPAGPAPTMTAVFDIDDSRFLGDGLRPWSRGEKEEPAQYEVHAERESRGEQLAGDHRQMTHADCDGDHDGVDHQPGEPQREEKRQLERSTIDATVLEYELHRQPVER